MSFYVSYKLNVHISINIYDLYITDYTYIIFTRKVL